MSPDPIFDQAILYIRENFRRRHHDQRCCADGGHFAVDIGTAVSRASWIVPTDEILRLRLQRASELLARPELSLRDVAMQSGFGDTRTLNHAMSKQFGMTAQEFRQQLGGKPALPKKKTSRYSIFDLHVAVFRGLVFGAFSEASDDGCRDALPPLKCCHRNPKVRDGCVPIPPVPASEQECSLPRGRHRLPYPL